MAMKRGKATKNPGAARGTVDMNWYYEAVHEYLQRNDWPPLTARGFLVWAALGGRAVPMVGIASVSHEQLRTMTKARSKSTVQRGLAELIEKGYIARVEIPNHRHHLPFTYHLLRRVGGSKSKGLQQVGDLMVKVLSEDMERANE